MNKAEELYFKLKNHRWPTIDSLKLPGKYKAALKDLYALNALICLGEPGALEANKYFIKAIYELGYDLSDLILIEYSEDGRYYVSGVRGITRENGEYVINKIYEKR